MVLSAALSFSHTLTPRTYLHHALIDTTAVLDTRPGLISYPPPRARGDINQEGVNECAVSMESGVSIEKGVNGVGLSMERGVEPSAASGSSTQSTGGALQ